MRVSAKQRHDPIEQRRDVVGDGGSGPSGMRRLL
jgi:hypothetical protein